MIGQEAAWHEPTFIARMVLIMFEGEFFPLGALFAPSNAG
jgi:hypothetical protein